MSFFSIAMIVLAVSLIVLLSLQVKGGGIGGIFGQADSVYRTRRGAEKIMFQLTIIIAVLLCVAAILNLITSYA
jgi:preprotein translocase subunit SecG